MGKRRKITGLFLTGDGRHFEFETEDGKTLRMAATTLREVRPAPAPVKPKPKQTPKPKKENPRASSTIDHR